MAVSHQQSNYPRFWIFQSLPERYDLKLKLHPKGTTDWIVTKLHQQMSPGDIVYFWRGGRNAGFYGWGEINGEVYPDTQANTARAKNLTGKRDSSVLKVSADTWRVPVVFMERFSTPMTKQQLLSDELFPHLLGLPILRNPQGASFKVTSGEARYLNLLIANHDESSPIDPYGLYLDAVPISALAPITLGKSAKRIVYAKRHFNYDNKHIPPNKVGLFQSLIAYCHTSEAPKSGTAEFIRNLGLDRFYAVEDQVWQESIKPSEYEEYTVSEDFLDVLESARLLAIQSCRREQIEIRHLFAAMFVGTRDRDLIQINESLKGFDLSLLELVDQFVSHTTKYFPNDDSSMWLNGYQQGVEILYKEYSAIAEAFDSLDGTSNEEVAWTESEAESTKRQTSRAFTRIFSGSPLADQPLGADLLQIDNEVAALAHLFALKEGEDPGKSKTFAVGLFGRWGSGKSFFIEKLKKQIYALSKKQSEAGQTSPYFEHIVPIDFNAWHYNESEIWASLVHHIFDSLHKHFKANQMEEEFADLLRQLESAQEKREELQRSIKTLESEKSVILNDIETINGQIQQNVEKQLEKPTTFLKNEAVREKVLGLVPEIGNLFGVDTSEIKQKMAKDQADIREVLTTIESTGMVANETKTLLKSLLKSSVSPWFIAALAASMGIFFLVPILLTHFDLYNKLTAINAQALVTLVPALVWLRTKLSKAKQTLDEVAALEVELRQALFDEEASQNQKLVQLEEDKRLLTQRLEDERKTLAQKEQDIAKVNQAIDKLGTVESLEDFINERATSQDYRSRLGILALIRRDFQKLSDIITGRPSVMVPGANRNIGQDGDTHNVAKIDRIILYIDDLDRVQDSEKVLQVLEAVHLLLALPLFHVVLAVDERWAARSVRSHHNEVLDYNGQGLKPPVLNGDSSIGNATPREYLEKIFQISFWVRPLSDQLTKDLIEGLLDEDRQTSDFVGYSAQAEEAQDDHPEAMFPSNPQTQAAETLLEQIEVEAHAAPYSAEMADDQALDDMGPIEDEELLEALSDLDDDETERQVSFDLSEQEVITMRSLSCVVGRSPRTVKRFVNTYRLFKAMDIAPDNSSWDPGTLYGERIAEFHVPIMVLLAIQIGHPDASVTLFEHLDEYLNHNDDKSFSEFSSHCVEKGQLSERATIALQQLAMVDGLFGDEPSLGARTVSMFHPWMAATARFGFQEWRQTRQGLSLTPQP